MLDYGKCVSTCRWSGELAKQETSCCCIVYSRGRICGSEVGCPRGIYMAAETVCRYTCTHVATNSIVINEDNPGASLEIQVLTSGRIFGF